MAMLNRKLMRDLGHMRGQVLAVTLIVACGIATYVTMQSAYVSLYETQLDYYTEFRLADVFAHLKRAPESLAPTIAAIPGVDVVQTRVVMDVSLDVPGLAEPASGRLVSVPPNRMPILNDLDVRAGRYIDRTHRDEVLISQAFAEANHLEIGDALSAVINGKWERLQIVGIAMSPEYVYEVRPTEIFPDNRRFGILWMSRDAFGPAFNMDAAFNDVVLKLSREADEQEVIARLDQVLERYGCLGAYGRRDHISWRMVNDHLEEIRTSGVILPTIFLAIVGFLLNILMSRIVSTQRAQIAVLKAFGYSDFEVALHYLMLALVAVAAGTVVGIGLGLWFGSGLTALFGRYFRFPSLLFHPSLKTILLATGISGVAACFGALSAVRKAVALSPAQAMRPETPPRFRIGLVERFGFRAFLSPASRMIVRNLDRRRLRTFLSSLAVGFAVAILVLGWYRIDAIYQLADIQFNTLQREDVTVIFREPTTDAVVYELSRLPGVLRVEPFRDAPVRIRAGNKSRRTSVSGLVPDSELRRPVDSRLQPVELPPEGLLLNSRLAEVLHVREGNTVTIESLEGRRRAHDVVVISVVDEPVGLGAYMEVSALGRLIRTGRTFSGAYLRVDPLFAPQLYLLLKRMPAVSGVAVRETMRASFWKTVGESITSTTVILVGFASVIAFGIVYNGASIALSERGNELAALRVLGFTRFEIGCILLGEQGIITLLAIPIGFALGFALSFWTTQTHSPDLLRLPFVVNPRTYIFAAAAVFAATVVSGLFVARRLQRMDLTAVLKSRE